MNDTNNLNSETAVGILALFIALLITLAHFGVIGWFSGDAASESNEPTTAERNLARAISAWKADPCNYPDLILFDDFIGWSLTCSRCSTARVRASKFLPNATISIGQQWAIDGRISMAEVARRAAPVACLGS